MTLNARFDGGATFSGGLASGRTVINDCYVVDSPQQAREDLRFTRVFRFAARTRLQGSVDIYNLMNTSNVLNMTTRYGPAWLNAIQIMGGRLMKVSLQLDF